MKDSTMHNLQSLTLASYIRMNELRPTTIPQILWVCTSIHMADTLKTFVSEHSLSLELSLAASA